MGRLKVGMNWWRDMLLIKGGHEDLVSNAPAIEDLRRHAGWISTPQVVRAINATRETIEFLESNVNPRLSLDVLMLSLPQKAEPGQPGAIEMPRVIGVRFERSRQGVLLRSGRP